MAEQLPQVTVSGQSGPEKYNPLEDLFRKAATTMGYDINNPKTEALVQKNIDLISSAHPGKDDATLAQIAKANILALTFSSATAILPETLL